jgi:SecD/SecF fusion protein
MDASTFKTLLIFAGVVVMLVGPFFLGGYLAKLLRMPDYGWKVGLILFTAIVSVAMITIKWPPKFGIDLSGGVILIYEIDKEALKQEGKQLEQVDMDKLVGAISLRVNPGGQKEVTIRKYGQDEIEIVIPNVNEVELNRVKETVSQTGKLEFRIVANMVKHKAEIEMARANPDKTVIYDSKNRWICRWVPVRQGEKFNDKYNAVRQIPKGNKLETQILVVNDVYNVTGDFLASAKPGNEFGKPIVEFMFNSRGGRLFAELTGDNRPSEAQSELKNQLAIILDNTIESAPNILTTISDRGQITGSFTEEEVKKIVDVLNAGSLPAALAKTPVQELNCNAQLGSDTIQKSTYAMLFSALLVVAFMLVYYRFSGMIAVIALVINILGIVAVMITFNAAFTLTGFAALALTVGMAVDNNVLIYERMREELAKGAALRMAIRNAFNRVATTIVDCNMTHVIVAIVLWAMGSEQIRGFAVALLLGVVFSMFTAVFVSHVLFDIAERHHWVTKLKMMHVIGHTSIDFMRVFPICLTFSVVITVLGLAAAYYRGYGLFDIDFTGGVSVQVLFDQSHKGEEIYRKLKEEDKEDKQLPDLAVNEVHITGEDYGLRFDIITSRRKGPEETADAPELVKNFIQQVYGDQLKKNTLAVENLGPALPKVESPVPPAGGQVEPKPDEKSATPEPAKQSSTKRPAASWFAAIAAAQLLFGQVEAAPAAPPADAAKVEQAADKPAEVKPGDKKPDEKKPADAPPADTKPADTKPAQPATTTSDQALGQLTDPFAGGSQAELKFSVPIDHSKVEEIVKNALKAAKYTPENVRTDISGKGYIEGDPDRERVPLEKWTVRLALPQQEAGVVFDAAKSRLAGEPFFPASNSIGSAVAGSTRTQAIFAIVASWALIILYLWIRFQGVAFGLAAVIALIHDVLVMLGAIAFSFWLAQIPGFREFLFVDQFKINLPIIAAFLTIIGYSVNDTIVVFDRIREIRGKDPYLTRKMVNDATNQTLSRTIITSLTVFMVVVVLYWAGGPALRGFSFALTFGVLTGTYSSIYVAAPILLWLVGKHKVTAEHPHYEGPKS